MDGTESEESGWTKANLQKLLAAMKTSIPERDRMIAYPKALKSVDWNQVAFPPFSPEACQNKWRQILQKMRKIRTLTELIDEAEGVISDPVQNSKIHPELPKRPSPPNSIFLEENWAKFHEKHPKMSRRKLLRRLMKKYQELPDEEKAQYVEKFEHAREEYKRRMLEFSIHYKKSSEREPKRYQKRKKLSAETPDQGKQGSETANNLPPKPPCNGYSLFCKEQRASMTGVSGNNYVSVWAQRWRDLTARERDEYNTRCSELKRQYSIKLNEYLMDFDEETQQKILNENGITKTPKSTRKDAKKLPGEPKMPPLSGNAIFCQNQMKLLKEEFPNSRERFAKVSQMWRDFSVKKKESYRKEVHDNIRKYSVELQKWFKTLPAEEQEAYQKHNPSKCHYLNVKQMSDSDGEEPNGAAYRPSDSEDEDIEDSSSDEEEGDVDRREVEEQEEEDDVISFEVY